jgi:DNA-binding transcriptional MocR family regulator
MQSISQQFEEFRALGMKLDMSRGKPSPAQLDLSRALLDTVKSDDALTAADGTDCRNYGVLLGLPEARKLFADLLDVPAAQLVAADNSSLSLMHDALAFALLHGTPGQAPWRGQEPVSFICPVPGYDRHFAICEALGVRMINVDLKEDGPDMDAVEKLVAADASIKGIWCIPKYSNPTGTVYSAAVAQRLAQMSTAAPDFRIFWDDAYRFHHLSDQRIETPRIVELCAAAGHPDRVLVFASTSKITFAGAGVGVLAGSPANLAWWQKCTSVRTIGPDKINQLRHVRFLRDRAGVEALMERHRALLQPRFEAVEAVFSEYLGKVEGVSWTRPQGGYFINLVTPPGQAKRTVDLAKQAGITLTPAGASFPYGKDPQDRHIRIAPSFPSLEEIRLAAKGVSLALLQAIAG